MISRTKGKEWKIKYFLRTHVKVDNKERLEGSSSGSNAAGADNH
jgi:hypothetical protein